VQIVGGGLLGLVIAQLILWWMPGNWARDKRDPLGIAGSVAAYAPFVVPAKVLVANSSAPKSDATTNAQTSRPDAKDNPPADEMRYGMQGQEEANKAAEPSDTARDDKATKEPTSEEAGPSDQTTLESSPSAADSPTSTDRIQRSRGGLVGGGFGGGLINPENATPVNATKNEPARSTNSAPPAANPAGIRDKPPVDGQQIAALLSRALAAETVWDKGASAPLEERKKQWKDFYRSFAMLGEAMVFVDREDPVYLQELPRVHDAVVELAKKPDKLNLIGAYGIRLINLQRDDDAAVLYGTVVDYQPSGRFHKMKIKLDAQQNIQTKAPVKTEIEVLRRMPEEPFSMNAKVLVLGTFVMDPSQNIEGYEGEEPIVAYEGYSVSLPNG
jgi:hypothetical protein